MSVFSNPLLNFTFVQVFPSRVIYNKQDVLLFAKAFLPFKYLQY